jgi:hypothetical protein
MNLGKDKAALESGLYRTVKNKILLKSTIFSLAMVANSFSGSAWWIKLIVFLALIVAMGETIIQSDKLRKKHKKGNSITT